MAKTDRVGWTWIKMNLRRKTPPDSLYLLLDTLCNAFGGIILLAVLVVLLTSKEKSQSATASDSQEMLQRRLALSQTNLQQSLQLAASLNAKASCLKYQMSTSTCCNTPARGTPMDGLAKTQPSALVGTPTGSTLGGVTSNQTRA